MVLNIQVLRALAALLVAWVHAREILPTDSIPAWAGNFGYGGVDLFFVISGFIMIHTTDGTRIAPLTFVRKRVRRVAPLYYVITLAVVIAAILLPEGFRSTKPELSQIAKSLLFIPFEKEPGRIYPTYYLGWTLNYEMFFYALFGLTLFVREKLRAALLICLLILLVASGILITHYDQAGIAGYVYTRPIVLNFAAGVLIARLLGGHSAIRLPARVSWGLIVLASLWFVFGGAVLGIGADAVYPPTDTFFRFGLPSALIVAAMVALEKQSTLVGGRLLRRLGDASYSIYLSHFLVIGAFIALANRLDVTGETRIGVAVMAMAVAVATGVATYYLVERPLGHDFSVYRNIVATVGALLRSSRRPTVQSDGSASG